MKTACVTGGAGFIGSHIVDSLVDEGYRVLVLDDLSSGLRSNLNEKAELHVVDIRSAEARKILSQEQPDVLVHTAAQISVRLSMEDPVKDTEVNLVGLINLLHAFSGSNLPHVVFTSTGGAIYGEQETYPAPETHPKQPDSVYGLAKYVSELYLDLWERTYGLKYCALRLGNVYGPRQNPHGEAGVIAIFSTLLSRGEQPTINGSGEQTRDYVFVGDVANAVREAVRTEARGIYNIGTGVETSVTELFETLASELNFSKPALHGPAKIGEQMRSCIDAGQAARVLGWQPSVTIQDGLRQTAAWFKENK